MLPELDIAHSFAVSHRPCYTADWYDSDYCWHAEYDEVYGTPLGVAERTSTYSWRRSFSGCDVEVDVEGGTAEIRFHAQ